MRSLLLVGAVAWISAACRCPAPAIAGADCPCAPPAAPGASADVESSRPIAESGTTGAYEAGGDRDGSVPGVAAPGEAQAPGSPVGPPAESLPEVRVTNVGLHVGGGPNDAASKAPFQDAVAAHFDDFRRCYALVGEPGSEGVFGVDLRIPREGGQAAVQASRTGMKGGPFRACVLDVFSRVRFSRPARGPTVISYSLRYSVGGD